MVHKRKRRRSTKNIENTHHHNVPFPPYDHQLQPQPLFMIGYLEDMLLH